MTPCLDNDLPKQDPYYQRKKDRMSYTQQEMQVDLTQVFARPGEVSRSCLYNALADADYSHRRTSSSLRYVGLNFSWKKAKNASEDYQTCVSSIARVCNDVN